MYTNFNLIMVDLHTFSFEANNKIVITATLPQVISVMVHTFDFDIEEIEFAVMDMVEKENDIANFGIFNHGFIYSSKRKVA
jgi:hypothetical protein